MAETTAISWTKRTWNPWRGCSKVKLPNGTPHPGCEHCYAERMSKRNPAQLGIWGDDGTRVRAVQKTFENPLKWDREAAASGRIDDVFVDSMSDFFEDREDVAPWRKDAFGIMDRCQNLHFQILTKRPENIRIAWTMRPLMATLFPGCPGPLGRQSQAYTRTRKNVTLCYSASNQQTLSYGVPLILECSDLCATIGISLEPMLGAVNLGSVGEGNDAFNCIDGLGGPNLGWVIIGCESNGPRVGRLGDFASESDWWDAAADVVRQCADAGVPCFMKQGPRNGRVVHDPDEFPEPCRVREFPASTSPAV